MYERMKHRATVVERGDGRRREGRRGKFAPHEVFGLEHFGVYDLERGNLGVPFQQRGHAPGQFVRQAV